MLNLLLLICLHGNFDLLVANAWFCSWCSATKSVDVELAFAMWIMQMFLKVPGQNYMNMKVECSIISNFVFYR